jgi:hypothetical protein
VACPSRLHAALTGVATAAPHHAAAASFSVRAQHDVQPLMPAAHPIPRFATAMQKQLPVIKVGDGPWACTRRGMHCVTKHGKCDVRSPRGADRAGNRGILPLVAYIRDGVCARACARRPVAMGTPRGHRSSPCPAGAACARPGGWHCCGGPWIALQLHKLLFVPVWGSTGAPGLHVCPLDVYLPNAVGLHAARRAPIRSRTLDGVVKPSTRALTAIIGQGFPSRATAIRELRARTPQPAASTALKPH